jgi:hypothetical protein
VLGNGEADLLRKGCRCRYQDRGGDEDEQEGYRKPLSDGSHGFRILKSELFRGNLAQQQSGIKAGTMEGGRSSAPWRPWCGAAFLEALALLGYQPLSL